MARTIYFYNVGIYLNDELTNLSFLELLDNIDSFQKDRLKVVRKVDDKISGIFDLYIQNEYDVRVVPFGKFREDFKPYIGEITRSKLDQIKKSVVELVTVYYEHSYRTACIDFNQHGLKIKDLEKYLNTFFPKGENSKWEVKFEPVIINKGINNISNSQQIKKITLKLDLKQSSNDFIKSGAKEKLSFLETFGKMKSDFDANVLKIEFGVGNKQNATLDIEKAIYLLNILNLNTDYLASLEVTYHNNKIGKVDTVNLKQNNVELKDKILTDNSIKNPAPEVISVQMKEKFEKNKGAIISSFRGYTSKMKHAAMPTIMEYPREENKIEVKEKSEVNLLQIVEN